MRRESNDQSTVISAAVRNTVANGKVGSVTATAECCGKTAQFMKEIGYLGEHRAKANSHTLVVTCMRVNGARTEPMATVFIIMSMGRSTRARGGTTFSMVEANKHTPTERNIMEIMSQERNMELAGLSGAMGQLTSENGRKTK